MAVIEISSLDDPRVSAYARLTGGQLRNRQHQGQGVVVAESPKVINVALRAGLEPLSLLCERRHLTGDAAGIVAKLGDVPVYTGSRGLLQGLTGYALTRGVLCAMRRPAVPTAAQVCAAASRVAVIHGVVDATNVGAIFRSAAALGIDAVLVTSDSCDPLCRRAIRVSMGTVFLVPWAWVNCTDSLHELGLKTVAMALRDNSIALDDPRLCAQPRLAIVVGTEGDGLPQQAIDQADWVVRIPMARGVDSLNVSTAAALAFWQLRRPHSPTP